MTMHKQQKTKENKSSICEICGMSFSLKRGLRNHILNKHTDSNLLRVKCDICQKWSKNIFTLKKHKKNIHSLRNVQCVHCQKYYKSPARLRVHVRITHEEPTKFKCNLCDHFYNTNEKLKVF